jgi:hypothetical protein
LFLYKSRQLEKLILKDKELLCKIEKLKQKSYEDKEYMKLKSEICSNEMFKTFKELENDTFLFIQLINSKLNLLREKSGCK